MKVAFVLILALVCVAVASAGRSEKHKGGKHHKKNGDTWENKKNYKNKENNRREEERGRKNSNKYQQKKKTKREENVDEINPQDTVESKKVKRETKPTQEQKVQGKVKEQKPTDQIHKKKDKYIETAARKEEWKTNKKHEKTQKMEEIQKEEPSSAIEEEEVVIESVEEPSQETLQEEGECQEETVDQCSEDEPEVVLPSGAKVIGKKGKTVSGKDTAEFQGVPYAEAPEGKDRLKEAVIKDSWPGVLRATSPGNDCLQYSHFSYSIVGSEDCLYLNIYTPKLPKAGVRNTALMPVVVYIHGGCFMFFSSALAGPKYLLDKDVVLVTINYRLGPLGFFTLGDDTVPSNIGLRDQMTALKWIQKNIESFGGDPNRVTLTGMSAGGASVHYHILSPLSTGLFERAISISGTALNPWAEAENLVDKSLEIAAKLGCTSESSQEIVDCLKSRPAEKIVATAKDLQVWLYNPISPWAPSPDPESATDPFLPDSPINIILDGKANPVPWLISYTDKEGAYPGAEFLFNTELKNYLEKHWNELIPHLLEFNFTAAPNRRDEISDKIKQFYLKGRSVTETDSNQPLIQMLSDRMFVQGIHEAATAHSSHYPSPIYAYRFSHSGQDSVAKSLCHCNESLGGACHADDLGYFLDALSPKLTEEEDLMLSEEMVSLWHSFVTSGVPKFKGQNLPRIDGNQKTFTYLDIGQNGAFSLISEEDPGNQKFWNSLGLSDLFRRESSDKLRKDEL